MKRNVNLQELSRDHHHGLMLGWKIREGIKRQVDPAQIKEYVVYFFDGALLPHFKEEEELILSYLPEDNELKRQTIDEHRQMEQMVRQLGLSNNCGNRLLEFGKTLEEHIRFEERTLFPYLEQNLSDEELEELGKAIAADHFTFTDSYPYTFWKSDN